MSEQSLENGGRILLLRQEVDEHYVHYAVELETSDTRYRGSLRIVVADGAVELGAFEPEPPQWLLDAVAPLARTLATGRRKSPDAPWPRRLHRWREQKT